MKYKYLQVGDVVKKGDEWLSPWTTEWFQTAMPGRIVGQTTAYRRPIKKKKGSK